MAVLTDPERLAIRKKFGESVSVSRTLLNLSKVDLYAAIAAIDDWVDANAVSFNQAIPLPARTSLTAQQKAALFFYVVLRRFEVA